MESLYFTSTFEFTFFGVCNPLCEFCVCICVCLYFIFVCSVQKSYRATRHQWQFPQFAAAAFKFNSTSIQTHIVAATIQRNTEYRRILAHTWTCYEAKHSNHQLDIDLMPRCCSSHQDTLQNLKSLWKPKCSIAKPKNPPTIEGRGATLKFTSLPSAPPDATEMLWEVLNRSNLKQGIQNTKARSECTTV